jgi:hypothetical protein
VLADECAIYVDDGCGYQDGLGLFKGIRVQFPNGADLSQLPGRVTITGISRIEKFAVAAQSCGKSKGKKRAEDVYVPSIWVRTIPNVLPPTEGGISIKGPGIIGWPGTLFNNGRNLKELQIFRDTQAAGATTAPFYVISDPAQFATGRVDLSHIYADGSLGWGHQVNYNEIQLGVNFLTAATYAWPAEYYGLQHTYEARAIVMTAGTEGGSITYSYDTFQLRNTLRMTCVEPIAADPMHIISPMSGEYLLVDDLRMGAVNFAWAPSIGASDYLVTVEPVEPGISPAWHSSIVYQFGGASNALPDADRLALASYLSNPALVDRDIKWRVDARDQSDTPPLFWTEGGWNVAHIAASPDMPPPPPF